MKFRKKPIVVEAFEWTGDDNQEDYPDWIKEATSQGIVDVSNRNMNINTPEGRMTAIIGDWIIQGMAGEIYPIKPEIFKATYSEVITASDGKTDVTTNSEINTKEMTKEVTEEIIKEDKPSKKEDVKSDNSTISSDELFSKVAKKK